MPDFTEAQARPVILPAVIVANLGSVCAWLSEDETAKQHFTAWYNDTRKRLGKPGHTTSESVEQQASQMFTILREALSKSQRQEAQTDA